MAERDFDPQGRFIRHGRARPRAEQDARSQMPEVVMDAFCNEGHASHGTVPLQVGGAGDEARSPTQRGDRVTTCIWRHAGAEA